MARAFRIPRIISMRFIYIYIYIHIHTFLDRQELGKNGLDYDVEQHLMFLRKT